MDDETMIRTEMDGAVAIVTLDRPDRLNAAPPAMFEQLRAAIDRLPADGARALLIRGEGRAFCSGADLSGTARDADPAIGAGAGSRRALRTSYNPALLALHQCEVPVVTAVTGPAAGIGCSLALMGDLCVAAQSAYFLQAFVNIGLMPDGGSTWLLPRLVGLPRAMELMLLGERLPAPKAAAWGLIHAAVPDDALDDSALALARRLAAGPTVAMREVRQIVRRGLQMDFASALDAEAIGQGIAGSSADAAEGIMAFLSRRAPAFEGR